MQRLAVGWVIGFALIASLMAPGVRQEVRSVMSLAEVRIAAAGSPGQIPLDAEGLAAGDSVERPLVLENVGEAPLSGIVMQREATEPSPLFEDAERGLRIELLRCNEPWSETASRSFACGQGAAFVVTEEPVDGGAVLTDLAALEPGGRDHLLLRVSLPQEAGNGLAGRSVTIAHTFAPVVTADEVAPRISLKPARRVVTRARPLQVVGALDEAGAWRLQIRNRRGRTVFSEGGRGPLIGTVWRGTSGSGRPLKPGTYRWRVVAYDLWGNRAASKWKQVELR